MTCFKSKRRRNEKKIMLIHANKIVGCEIEASDGSIGIVDDILFDDRSWTCRYLVADVGQKLQGRTVLLSFETVTHIDESRRQLRLPITTRAIEKSPDVTTQNPVSMEAELLLGKYWQWSPYWEKSMPRTIGENISASATLPEKQEAEKDVRSHLRSVGEIEGYHIAAPDGDIGHLQDLVINDSTWQIEYLIVNTGNWLFQRKVLIPCVSLENIRWADRKVHVSLSRDEIKNSPEYNPEQPISRDYAQALQDHYRKQPCGRASNPPAEITPKVETVNRELEEPDLRGVVIPKILK
jgi:sporulation protein YlmC with PRC-barrel domain